MPVADADAQSIFFPPRLVIDVSKSFLSIAINRDQLLFVCFFFSKFIAESFSALLLKQVGKITLIAHCY